MSSIEILELLKRDHREVADLLDEIDDTDDKEMEKRRRLYGRLRTELLLHAHGEVQTAYSELGTSEMTQDLEMEFEEEHRRIAEVLDQMDRLDPSNDLWFEQFEALREMVTTHVDEEESEMFPELKRNFPEEERVRFGKRFLEAKELYRSHVKPVAA